MRRSRMLIDRLRLWYTASRSAFLGGTIILVLVIMTATVSLYSPYKPDAMDFKQRRRLKAVRKDGFSAAVSERALIMRLPILGSFAQDGTRPHFINESSPGSRLLIIGTCCVGAML